jgi:hypothetical protein
MYGFVARLAGLGVIVVAEVVWVVLLEPVVRPPLTM